jgi:acetyl esterase/lipase
VALAILANAGCHVTDLPLWGPGPPSPTDPFEVEQVRGLAYYEGPDADPYRHRLDLFLPRGATDYPVAVLVHGGAWLLGDNRCCGLYSAVGEALARQGIGVVMPNYRLSPHVKHPEHVKDVARVFAWTHAHIAAYGGSPRKLFLAGHSAGGHLVALLATDERYLRAEGLETADVKGVIAVSGVFRIPAGRLDVTLGGATPLAFRLDECFPLRGTDCGAWSPLAAVPGVPLRLNVFGPAFGDDAAEREDASPLAQVRPGLPPFLIACAENDLPTLPDMAAAFHRALLEQGGEAQLLTVPGRNHNSIFFQAAEPEDPLARAMRDFIWRHARLAGAS